MAKTQGSIWAAITEAPLAEVSLEASQTLSVLDQHSPNPTCLEPIGAHLLHAGWGNGHYPRVEVPEAKPRDQK